MGNGFLGPENPAEVLPSKKETPALPVEVSSVEMDEQALEQLKQEEARDHFLETDAAQQGVATQASAPATPVQAIPKDEITIHIEQILEEGLERYFSHLPPEAQEPFRKKGQEVAGELTIMVKAFRLKVKRAVLLIRAWLMTIPGVNAFFLEQEAKIKTDQLLAYQEELRNRSEPPQS